MVSEVPDRRDQADGSSTERDSNRAALGYVAGEPALTEPDSREPAGDGGASSQPDLHWHDGASHGSHPGDRYIRVARHIPPTRPSPRDIAIVARDPGPPRTSLGQFWRGLKRTIIGQPLATAHSAHERLTKVKALAVLSSDAISSVAYGPEAALLVLATAGAGALRLNLPIILAIVALLAIVTISYRQTIFAYPSGGGSYIVASENLGRLPGLVAGAALLIDYVLTVAVSIASGVAALISAAPGLGSYAVPLGLGFILLIMFGNLRGVREAGNLFAVPPYLFIASLVALVGIGLVRVFILGDPAATGVPREPVPGGEALGALLILKAFSSGCTSMTGVEAVSNGVPAFEPPESRNAATTMLWMSGILGALLIGMTVLAERYGLVPSPTGHPTLLSQLTEQVAGRGPFYFFVQVATLLILVLAANTAYADFPRVASILAKDRFLPRQFAFQGDRLAYTVGIVVLSAAAALLVVVYRGNVEALIPLFAVGVFVAFTMSQAGMVVRWWRRREPGWVGKAAINGLGAVIAAVVATVAGATKLISGEPLFHAFGHNIHAGSWIVLLLIPLLILNFLAIHRHYAEHEADLAAETPVAPDAIRHTMVVPIADVNHVAPPTRSPRSATPGVGRSRPRLSWATWRWC
jgi:amino acid transporter